MAGKISSENTFAHDFSKKLRSRLVSRRLRSNMDNCWLPLALYDIFRHHPVFIYIISNLKYCVTPPFDLNVTFWYKPLSLSFHSIEIGGAVSVRSLAGRLFRYPCCSRSLSARLTAEWIFLICDDYGPTLLRSNASVCCLEHHGLHRLHASYPIEISSSREP